MRAFLCPSCKSSRVKKIGTIPSTDEFAGRILPESLPGGYLYHCRDCGLRFRLPRLSKRELDELYRQGSSDKWQYTSTHRIDWALASHWILKNGIEGKILDVGCLDGGFLLSIGNQFQRFGIEINQDAVKTARERGIKIIGDDFDALKSVENEFNAVFAMDVIEHVVDPLRFLSELARATLPGGDIIISTGNNMAFSWRIMGSRYWYCANAEHISFISPNWCQHVASKCGLRIDHVQCFSHAGNPQRRLSQRLKETSRNIFYLCFPYVFAWLREHGFGEKDVAKSSSLRYFPPGWMTAKDHFIVIFRKIR